MLAFLNSIVESITTVFSLILHFIGSFLTFFNQLPRSIAFLTTAIGLLPSVLIVFATAAVSVYVLLFILGRQ